jgi:hypothetical protein
MIMDPQETWKKLLDAWTGFEWEEVDQLADALLCWLDDGGFPPELETPRELGAEFNATVVRYACGFVRRRATSVLDNPNRIPQDVPFTLTCGNCNNEGPDSENEARHEGWQDISYVPTSLSEDFSGLCPTCQSADS